MRTAVSREGAYWKKNEVIIKRTNSNGCALLMQYGARSNGPSLNLSALMRNSSPSLKLKKLPEEKLLLLQALPYLSCCSDLP